MTLDVLIDALQLIRSNHGGELPVYVLDGELELPFGLHVGPMPLIIPEGLAVYVDPTAEPNSVQLWPMMQGP